MYALVDCNNFYASCERVFQPKLNGKPIVILSNNDGCVISRSNEAKAVGVPMGVPLFKIKDLVKEKNIEVFSSNYALYGDLSNRVMTILGQFSPNLEIAKCDELLDNDEFKIGYLNDVGELIYTNDNYQKQIEMSPGNNETCRNCKLLPMCASGGCPVETLNLKDTIYSYSCTAVNYKSIEKKIENIINVMYL